MNIILFSHPTFMHSQSMPRFAKMLEHQFVTRGHQVTIWLPKAHARRLFPSGGLSKWAGYIDQYIFFPLWVKLQLFKQPPKTLFVFCDQALGPWVPLVKNKPHIIHVHDLLALSSALGLVPENSTKLTGRVYQRFIRWGFQQGKNFISVSNKTREDLHRLGHVRPIKSEVVYNGLNYPYSPIMATEAKAILKEAGLPVPDKGMFFHLSGHSWYKNVVGVIRIYAHYARAHQDPLPLWLVGPNRDFKIEQALSEVPEQGKVMFFYALDNRVIQAIYSLSRVFLFPSLEEGFGWPIIEAQSCGCPVITTDLAPMNEIGGQYAKYIPRLKVDDDAQAWAAYGATVLEELMNLSESERMELTSQSLAWAKKFNADKAIEEYLKNYREVLEVFA